MRWCCVGAFSILMCFRFSICSGFFNIVRFSVVGNVIFRVGYNWWMIIWLSTDWLRNSSILENTKSEKWLAISSMLVIIWKGKIDSWKVTSLDMKTFWCWISKSLYPFTPSGYPMNIAGVTRRWNLDISKVRVDEKHRHPEVLSEL